MFTNFNPVSLSHAENEFLLKHLGEPSVVALKSIRVERGPIQTAVKTPDKNPLLYPDGVIPASVKPILDGVRELMELEKAEGLKWVGIDAIKSAILTWQRENKKWSDTYKRTGGRVPRWPSLYSWDAKGRPHLGGPGSDSGSVKTYFGPNGERIPFAIDLLVSEYDTTEWKPPTKDEGITESLLHVDAQANRIECRVPVNGGVCGHTESFKEGNRASYNAARARMSKHLRKATEEADLHREVHTNEFGG